MVKKTDGPVAARKARKPVPDFAGRFLVLAATQLGEYIVQGREADAAKLSSEIEDYLSYAFRGVALMALRALIEREREQAYRFAGAPIVDFPDPGGYDESTERAYDARFVSGDVIDHN